MSHYQKPPELYDGLRLHQNENTGGCSARVLEALARLRADQIGFYPPYAAATDVDRDRRDSAASARAASASEVAAANAARLWPKKSNS